MNYGEFNLRRLEECFEKNADMDTPVKFHETLSRWIGDAGGISG